MNTWPGPWSLSTYEVKSVMCPVAGALAGLGMAGAAGAPGVFVQAASRAAAIHPSSVKMRVRGPLITR